MTLEQVQHKRDALGPDRLEALREECLQRQTGHIWAKSETNVPQTYCRHCLYLPGADRA